MYETQPEADAAACSHARLALLRRACSAWHSWLHQYRLPKAAVALRSCQHHQAVCKQHALQASAICILLHVLVTSLA